MLHFTRTKRLDKRELLCLHPGDVILLLLHGKLVEAVIYETKSYWQHTFGYIGEVMTFKYVMFDTDYKGRRSAHKNRFTVNKNTANNGISRRSSSGYNYNVEFFKYIK